MNWRRFCNISVGLSRKAKCAPNDDKFCGSGALICARNAAIELSRQELMMVTSRVITLVQHGAFPLTGDAAPQRKDYAF